MRKSALLVLGLAIACGLPAQAEDFVIQSFDRTGNLTFNEISNATKYRIEWASTPNGPWSNWVSLSSLDSIASRGTGSVTVVVPMCYRVVGELTTNLLRLNIDAEDQESPIITIRDGHFGPVLMQSPISSNLMLFTSLLTNGQHYIYFESPGYAKQWRSINITNGFPTPNLQNVTLYKKRYVVMSYAFNTLGSTNVSPGAIGVETGRYAVVHWGDLPHFSEDWQVWQRSQTSLWGSTPYLDWHRYTPQNGFIVSALPYSEITEVPAEGYTTMEPRADPGLVLLCRISSYTSAKAGYGKVLVENIFTNPPPGIEVRE